METANHIFRKGESGIFLRAHLECINQLDPLDEIRFVAHTLRSGSAAARLREAGLQFTRRANRVAAALPRLAGIKRATRIGTQPGRAPYLTAYASATSPASGINIRLAP
jgi:hypothetical protein